MPAPASADLAAIPGFAAPVPALAGLAFDGPDAASFLHGQLSTDAAAMPVGSVSLSTYNSPKGRVLASLVLFRRAPESFVALVAADLAAALRKRLAMFVLRAKIAVADASVTHAVVGVGGDGAAAALGRVFGAVPLAGHGLSVAEGEVLALPDGRYALLVAAGTEPALLARLGLRAVPGAFEAQGIRAGVPVVTLATQDRFVAQTLNFDLLGGIHFRKGCYPGQEIVARMQYLGRLKERLFAFATSAAPPAPGTPLVDALAPEPPAGTVVAAVAVDGGSELLAVASFAAVEGGALHLAHADGPALARLPLPYAIPAPAAPQRVKL